MAGDKVSLTGARETLLMTLYGKAQGREAVALSILNAGFSAPWRSQARAKTQ